MPSSLQQFKCPGCGTPFSAADVDNRRDTVTCSSCGLSTPWTSLVREHEFHDVPAAPSRHLTVTSAHGKVTLTYRHSFTKILLYTGLAVVWGIITLVLVLLSFGPGKTDFALPVFTTFFAVTEAFIIFLCVDMMLGKAVLRVEPGKASLFRGIGPVGSTWDFLLPAQAPIMMERKGGEKTDYCRISVPQLPEGRFTFPAAFQTRRLLNTSPPFCVSFALEPGIFTVMTWFPGTKKPFHGPKRQ